MTASSTSLTASTDARYLFSGLPTGKETLDSSKMMRGCKLLRLPAYCKINPFALSLAKLVMKDSYHKLLTVMATELRETQELQQSQSSQE
jgi:hypothetical protein